MRKALQGGCDLGIEIVGQDKSAVVYELRGWDPSGPEVVLMWDGAVDSFEGSLVCIIRPDLVELSGFGRYFPTVHPDWQQERFTYRLHVDLPAGWDLVTPGISHRGDTKERDYERLRPIEDIVMCAVPSFECDEVSVGGHVYRLYTRGLSDRERAAMVFDFSRCLEAMHRHFGPAIPGRGGVAVISPRGPAGAEWGFERGDLWVCGDSLVGPLVANDWVLEGLVPGRFSLALHETIHFWIGLSLEFAEHFLSEAITQYLQNVIGEELFGEPGLADKFFGSYVPRIEGQLAVDGRPVAELDHLDDHYVHWYLKGSWAFWDLEVSTGRENLMRALGVIYRRHAGTRIDYETFVRELGSLLDRDVREHMHHWFRESGFAPLYRGN
ncbi:MAG TPA: M1 family metallopeptidase [Firmicutes bacterium]|nr:M1 family metallopeptidase [Candidatus Fermentithermobacillaceae bacterium]